ncbi:MetQ/NlpA family ABC transporter substrate-binding protein [Brachyspira aalborgi]|uniref:Lipoprotein n=1 Tax=Brachyspira aalborgi TaxID=29522 RepID=A0A5C8FHB4_9SPIR|nr:MetQ/NlpA family ABC transporter substrate-binding protein [Brachyspira aalborgi]TXJ35726.1 MetQ/NlpA family ABC transporter substrate-binding protein [Brachyspira aalborgi]TXJ49008.1 MetQ/NlpA family ABC transporter substrate-binding protein [Brachyspira aalborgi]TXJ50216.1 MetQ/NlpA family ABC transporter substrate-binding protein [Brachyspira aalborgi]TXJ54902.1 MetQ/NlpA family ABC transporter substrate-binding protein [Brachyspira aalborgi]
MKNNFLKILIILTIALLGVFAIISCEKSSNKENNVVRVGFYTDSEYQIWNPVVSNLAKEGITVELVSFANTRMPNQALNNGDIDLNAFQHHAYLNDEVSNLGYDIVAIADTYISAMNIYSKNISNVSELKKGDKVAIPNDPSNEGRALKVLEAAGLIKVKPEVGDLPSISDIIENPLGLNILAVEIGSVPSYLPEVACAVINAHVAIDFGLNPGSDYIFQDNPSIYSGNAFVNLIAARTEDKDKEIYKKIIKAYQSEAVEEIYANNFKGSYLPTWK